MADDSYNNLAKSLYNVQQRFVPENPKDQLELDTTSNWFLYGDDSDETIILEDRYHKNVVFSTSEHLKI